MPQAKASPEQREAARITARILLDIKALNASPDKPFTFTSGRTSPVYVDIRRLISLISTIVRWVIISSIRSLR